MAPSNHYQVDLSMHAEIRAQLFKMFKEALKGASPAGGVIVLEGGKEQGRHDTDHELLFRQESYFHYVFGVKEPNYYGALDVASERSILFIERLHPDFAIWSGVIHPPTYYKELYQVDEAYYVDEMNDVLKKMGAKTLYVMKGVNTDSGKEFATPTFKDVKGFQLENFQLETSTLYPVIRESRVYKTPKEIEFLRYVVQISSDAHVEVMKRCRPGMMEYQLEAIFRSEVYFNGGCRLTGYTPICASGPNGAVLHYGHAGAPNSKEMVDGELVVLDMGGERHGYGADITRTIPVGGKYTPEQRAIYDIVLEAQQAVLKALKPGVSWPDMQTLTYKILLAGLKKHGFIQGSEEDLMANSIAPIFMPHGLGHFLGIDTHDVGGYPEGVERRKEVGMNRLRTARVMQERMVMTVEPGCYFIHALLEAALSNPTQSKFLNEKKIREFWNFGGIRLEDNVVITKEGIDNLTTTPVTVEEIEKIMVH